MERTFLLYDVFMNFKIIQVKCFQYPLLYLKIKMEEPVLTVSVNSTNLMMNIHHIRDAI
jgi:hypothetical protein